MSAKKMPPHNTVEPDEEGQSEPSDNESTCCKTNRSKHSNSNGRTNGYSRKLQAMQNNFVLYSQLGTRMTKAPRNLHRNVLYLIERQRIDPDGTTNKDNKENITQSGPETKIELIPTQLDFIKGAKYVVIEYFVLCKNRNSNGSETVQSFYIGRSDFDSNEKDFSKKKILIPFNILSNTNDTCQIYIGMIFRYFKCKEESSKKTDCLNEKNKNISEKSELYWCDLELELEIIGKFTLKLHKADKNKTIPSFNKEWTKINKNDVFCKQAYFASHLKSEIFFCFNLNTNNNLSSQQNIQHDPQILSEFTHSFIPQFNPDEFYNNQVIYNFKYSQTTTTMNNFVCPFCRMDCSNFGGLSIHLKANHDRFAFQFSSEPLIIDVSINENFESSCESDKLMNTFYGFETNHLSPLRRKPANFMMLSNEKVNYFLNLNEKVGNSCDLTELPSLFQESDYKRVYFHSQTCAPILPCEIDIDSEDEDFSDWLKQRTISMIDEFSDVNPGEKEMSKLWNMHVMKNCKIVLGESHIPNACKEFFNKHAEDIVKDKLRLNFILHLSNLHFFGLIPASLVQDLSRKLYEIEIKQQQKSNN